MAKATFDLTSVLTPYLERLKQELDLSRVLFIGESHDGVEGELSDVRFIVVSPTFEGMGHIERYRKLGRIGAEVDSVIQAWPYTPDEIARHFSREKYDLFLAQFLTGSREVYVSPGATPLYSLRKAAGG